MTRLERHLRRIQAQIACLDDAARRIADVPGPVFELGLGKARTYGQLRHLLPDRAIYAFDRAIKCPPGCMPPGDRVRLGDFKDTVPRLVAELGTRAALIHADFGSEEPAKDQDTARWLGDLIAAALAPGGIALSDRPLIVAGAQSLALPPPIAAGTYHLWRMPP